MMGQNEHPHPYSLKDRGEPEIITSIRVLIRIGMNWSQAAAAAVRHAHPSMCRGGSLRTKADLPLGRGRVHAMRPAAAWALHCLSTGVVACVVELAASSWRALDLRDG